MAVNESEKKPTQSETGGRRLRVGANVLVSIALALAIAGAAQWGAFKYGRKFDWSTAGINSLSAGTEGLLKSLNTPIRLTSAYFETDIEDDDQSKFRNAVRDLIDLFQSTNRSKIEAHSFNPIHDHEEKVKLIERISKLPRFVEQSKEYDDAIKRFDQELIESMVQLIEAELKQVDSLIPTAPEADATLLTRVKMRLQDLVEDLNLGQQEIADAKSAKPPRYSDAVSVMRTLYRNVDDWLTDVGEFGQQQAGEGSKLSEPVREFLSTAKSRYESLVARIKEEQEKLPSTALELDEIIDGLTPTGNALVVETDQEAKLVRFAELWPPANPEMPSAGAKFKDRAFEGERQITSAILRLTDKQKTAVIFVRFGGPGLISDAPPPIPGMPPPQGEPAYRKLNTRLEELNFDTYEWDLQAATTPPEMDPAPEKKIFVIFKPEEQNPFEQQKMPKPTFGQQHEKAMADAMGENGRAIYMGGYFLGAFGGAIPATYPFNEPLKEKWGLEVDITTLILENVSPSPGKWLPAPGPLRQGPFDLTDFEVAGDHPIVKRLGSLHGVWPWAAPLTIPATPAEGVKIDPLIVLPVKEGVWGVKDIQAYQKQIQAESVERAPEDPAGPFTVAAAATKADAKIVVFSARDFATDRYAQLGGMVLTAQGISMRPAFPANQTLFINSLHWLNDDEQRMELGRPLDSGTLTIEKESTVKFVKVLVYAIWPGLAAVCGLVVWNVRRR